MGIEARTSCQTRLKYAYDLRIFFDFLCKKRYKRKDPLDLTLEDLEGVTNNDIEFFLSYLSHYRFNEKNLTCDERAKARKLSAVRAMFKYFFNKGLIDVDNSAKVQTPKAPRKGNHPSRRGRSFPADRYRGIGKRPLPPRFRLSRKDARPRYRDSYPIFRNGNSYQRAGWPR